MAVETMITFLDITWFRYKQRTFGHGLLYHNESYKCCTYLQSTGRDLWFGIEGIDGILEPLLLDWRKKKRQKYNALAGSRTQI